jgi:hypothetical protein
MIPGQAVGRAPIGNIDRADVLTVEVLHAFRG